MHFLAYVKSTYTTDYFLHPPKCISHTRQYVHSVIHLCIPLHYALYHMYWMVYPPSFIWYYIHIQIHIYIDTNLVLHYIAYVKTTSSAYYFLHPPQYMSHTRQHVHNILHICIPLHCVLYHWYCMLYLPSSIWYHINPCIYIYMSMYFIMHYIAYVKSTYTA